MFTGISLTPEQMLEVFQWNKWGTKSDHLLLQSLSEFETGRREMFMDNLSEKLIGVDWPCGMDSEKPKYKNFNSRLKKAAQKAGYTIDEHR